MNRANVLLAVAVVVIGLAGVASASWSVDDGADVDAVALQASANGTVPATPAPTETSSSEQAATTPSSTFRVMATTDDELTYRFTVDGSVSRTRAADGTAAEDDDQITENDDGTTTVVGSTGDMAGDAYLVDGPVVSFERTGGESLYRLYRDDEEVTEELTPGSTFEVVSTDDDAELSFEFTVDGEVQRMVSEDGHAGDSSDEVVENGDGTTTVRGSTGFGAGDAFAVDGTVTSFERTGGSSGFVLYIDGEDVTSELTSTGGDTGDGGAGDGGDGADGGDGGDAGSGESGEEVYGDSTYDVSHTRSIESNGDGTTTVSGEVWNRNDGSLDGLVIVVEVYDEEGQWLNSAWVSLDPVTPERQSYSVTVDVPRDAIADFEVDVNTDTQAGPGNYPGRCYEIDGDGPDDQKLETGPADVIEADGRSVVVADVYNGKGRTVGLAHATVALYDDDGEQIGTRTVILEDLAEGDWREFAVVVDGDDGVAEAVADVDEIAIDYHGELACRPPL